MKDDNKLVMPTIRIFTHDNKLVIPTIHIFTPDKFVIKNRKYKDTGNGYVVCCLEAYIAEIDKTIWVGCNDESIGVYTVDVLGGNAIRDNDVVAYYAFNNELPSDVVQWLYLLKETITYAVDQQFKTYPDNIFKLPVIWLPDSIRSNVDSNYLSWLQAQGMYAAIKQGGEVIVNDEYQRIVKKPAETSEVQ